MNHATLYGQQVQPNTCGLTAVENAARAFWQSRMNAFDPPDLIDLSALAQAVRASFPTEEPAPC